MSEIKVRQFWIENAYSAQPLVFECPVDGLDDDAIHVIEAAPILKLLREMETDVKRAMFNGNLTRKDKAHLDNALEKLNTFLASIDKGE